MRGGTGLHVIQRARLNRGFAAAHVVLLEAPGGFGKSTAVQAYCRTLDRPTVRVVLRSVQSTAGLLASLAAAASRVGVPAIAEGIDAENPDTALENVVNRLSSADPVVIAVDEVQRLDADAARWLADFALEIPDTHRAFLAGRRLPAPIRRLSDTGAAILVTTSDLRFDEEEARRVIEALRGAAVETGELQSVMATTEGWPAAVVVAAGAGWPTVEFPAVRPDTVLRQLIGRLLTESDTDLSGVFGALSRLPLLSAEVAAVVSGPGTFERLLEAGLPVRFRPDGWGELPDAVREVAPIVVLSVDAAREVAAIYSERGELVEAATLLHGLADHAGLTRLLGRQSRSALQRSGLAVYDAMVAEVPDEVIRDDPSAIVQLARAADRIPGLRKRWISRGLDVVPSTSAAGRALTAELALDTARAGDLDGAEERASPVIAESDASEHTTLGRAHLCRGLCRLIRDTAGSTAGARSDFEISISRFHAAGDRDWEAEALQDLGYGVFFTSGSHEAAADALQRSLAMQPAPGTARATTLTYLAEVLTFIGRFDDAAVAVREGRVIAQRVGDERTIAYVAWTEAELRGQMRDREAALSALQEVERHPAGWFDSLAGIDFLSNSSEIRAMLGDADGARRDLVRAEERARGTPRDGEPLSARVRLEAMFGDPAEGLRLLDELEQSAFVYPNDRWAHPLFRAACHARLGDHDRAMQLVRRAQQIASDQGDPDRPLRREPELLQIAQPGPKAAREAQLAVVTLGRFAVERDGQDISPLPGRTSMLVKLLAVRGQVTVDEAIDELWPEADIDVGRRRLRNLLNRVRATSGDVVVRTDGALALTAGAQVDWRRFEQEAAAAIAGPVPARPGLARAALARSTGELLPADQYSEWTTVARERLRRRQLALIDIVSNDAIARQDFDEAERLLDEAIAVDPLDEERYVRLARALLAQGRVTRAQRVAQQALAVCSELGVEPSDVLATLSQELEAAPP